MKEMMVVLISETRSIFKTTRHTFYNYLKISEFFHENKAEKVMNRVYTRRERLFKRRNDLIFKEYQNNTNGKEGNAKNNVPGMGVHGGHTVTTRNR